MDVVVAGAGVGGLAASTALALAGHHVRCCERSPAARPDGAGIVLQPNGLAVLHALGIADSLVTLGSVLTEATVFDVNGHPLSSFPIVPGPVAAPALVVHRCDLIAALSKAAERTGVDVEFGTEVTTEPDGTILLRRDQQLEAVAPALLVAADGANSSVRRGRGFMDRPYGEQRWYLRTIVSGTAPTDLVGEHWGDGIAGVFPCGPGATYLYSTASQDSLAAIQDANRDHLIAALTGAHPALAQTLERISSIDDLLVNEVKARLVTRFVNDRTVLLGDAAHPMAPNLGQGANSALVDTAELTINLTRHTDLASALTAYDRNRRRPVKRVQQAAEMLARLGHLRHGRPLRDLALRATPASLAQCQARVIQQCDPVDLADRLTAAWTA